jgi:dethiobiotin synthetase
VSILLITGTDTGVGKTLVTAAIAAGLAASSDAVEVAKPIETGCPPGPDGLLPTDAVSLRAACGSNAPLDAICPFRFADPLAPSIAAERARATIDLERLATLLRTRSASTLLLVEGAGGLLVPITSRHTFADLASMLAAPILLVVGSRLGAINHALLTLEVIRSRGLAIRGYVLNRLARPGDVAADTNAAVLAATTSAPCLGELPWLADAPELLAGLRGHPDAVANARARLADLARDHIDLTLIRG